MTIADTLSMPYYTCPGNHDLPLRSCTNLYEEYTERPLRYVTYPAGIKLISLDSGDDADWWEWAWPPIDMVPEGSGLSASQYHWLLDRLNESPGLAQVLFMHHPVICCSSSYNYGEDCWNGCIYHNRDETWALLRDPDENGSYDDATKVVLSGHHHSTYQYRTDNLTSPAIFTSRTAITSALVTMLVFCRCI